MIVISLLIFLSRFYKRTIKKTKQIPAIILLRLMEGGKAGSAIPVTGFLSIDGA